MEISWTNPNLILPGVVILAIVLILLFFSYRRSSMPLWLKLIAGTIKLLACGLLLLFILDPQVVKTQFPPGVNHWVVLVDTSRSMQLKDQDNDLSRADRINSLLPPAAQPWETKLNQDFIVNNFSYHSKLHLLPRDQEISYDGDGSSLGRALTTLKERYEGQPLAGVLVLTDGSHTDALSPEGLPPVYPLVITPQKALRDLSLTSLKAQTNLFEDSPVVIDVSFTASGLKGEECAVVINEVGGKKLIQHTHLITSESESQSIRLEVKPQKTGTTFIEAKLTLKNPQVKEGLEENNTRMAVVNQKQGPYRVLYIGGRPNYEHKYLQRALDGDSSVRLTSLIRIAKREPKFTYRGRKGEQSNPLYRGSEEQEEVERFDESVLMRLNTKEKDELSSGFPKTAEELFPFDAVIIDDIEADFFHADQMHLLQRFVSERGGSLIMLGGMESLDVGGYHKTTLGELLPIYLHEGTPQGDPISGTLTLTREGLLEPWARLRKTTKEEILRQSQMPAFQNVHTIPGVRPGSVTISTIQTELGEYPALVTRRYGKGRTAALTVSNLWRWGFEDPASRKDLNKSWRQLVRWLLSDVPRPLTVEPETTSTATTQLTTTLLGKDFLPQDSGDIKLQVVRPDQTVTQLSPTPHPSKVGVLQTEYHHSASGPYLAQATYNPQDSLQLLKAETGWVSNAPQDEFITTLPKIDQLQQLAKATGGELLRVDQLNDFVNNINPDKLPVKEVRTTPLTHNALWLILALILFIGEWALRRWNKLP